MTAEIIPHPVLISSQEHLRGERPQKVRRDGDQCPALPNWGWEKDRADHRVMEDVTENIPQVFLYPCLTAAMGPSQVHCSSMNVPGFTAAPWQPPSLLLTQRLRLLIKQSANFQLHIQV